MVRKIKHWAVLVSLLVQLLFWSCATTARIGSTIRPEKLVDGIYEGSFKGGLNSAKVRVTIKDRKIVAIEILEHDTLKGKKAEPVIPKRIIEKQSTRVDAVTGATNSSNVVMNAVQVAVEKAYAESR